MNKYYVNGGLGDAAINFLHLPLGSYVIHCEIYTKLLPSISAFYTSQDIPNEVKLVSRDESHEMSKLYNRIRRDVHPRGVFPKIKFEKIEGIDVLINPISGRNRTGRLNGIEDLISRYPHRHFTITKWTETSAIPHLVNLICSANVIISPQGFVVFFGGMAGKKVYITGPEGPIKGRYHPGWDFHHILSLDEIKL